MESMTLEQRGQKLVGVLMLTLTMSVLSAFMFNVALPQIREAFQLTAAQVSWISSAYTLIYAIGSITYGKLADRYKLKRLLTIGLLIFAFGSAFGLLSQTFVMVLVARCLQAAGAAIVPATAMLIPVRYFSPERRGAAIGMTTVGVALGNALAPVVSGFIVSFADWRWLFAVPLLIVLTLPYYRKYLSDEQGTPAPFDWLGSGLLAASVALLLLGVTGGVWLGAGLGLAAFALFIWRMKTAKAPFIQPFLFCNKRYSLGLAIVSLVSAIGFSLSFLSPMLLAQVHQLPAQWIGLVMVPAAAVTALLGRTAGRLADAKGQAFMYTVGAAALIGCFGLLSAFAAASPLWIAGFLILGNIGHSFMLIAMSKSISLTLPKQHTGIGMGVLSLLSFISSAFAAGLYSKAVDAGAWTAWNPAFGYTQGAVYSNIYTLLALLHIVLLLVYTFQFRQSGKGAVSA